ncbi:MAG: hypothetical protein J5852_00075 [Clostridia bacterium]|nr:hypothetical protein [Clostridia bacterium]
MKGFFKFLGILASILAAAMGALAVFDKIANRNRIKDDYLDCSDNIEDNK